MIVKEYGIFISRLEDDYHTMPNFKSASQLANKIIKSNLNEEVFVVVRYSNAEEPINFEEHLYA